MTEKQKDRDRALGGIAGPDCRLSLSETERLKMSDTFTSSAFSEDRNEQAERLFMIALEHHQAKRFTDAQHYYRLAVDANTSDYRRHGAILTNLADVEYVLGSYEEAIRLNTECTQVFPGCQIAYRRLQGIYKIRRDFWGRVRTAIASTKNAKIIAAEEQRLKERREFRKLDTSV